MINFLPGIDTTRVSDYSRTVIARVMARAECASVTISSVCRTPHDFARILHDNCISLGVASQRRVYTHHVGHVMSDELPCTAQCVPLPTCAVIDVFVADVHKSRDETIDDMEAEVIRQGPIRCSHHCADPRELEVFDNTDRSLGNRRAAFKAAAEADPGVSKVLDENGVVHIEIPQPRMVA